MTTFKSAQTQLSPKQSIIGPELAIFFVSRMLIPHPAASFLSKLTDCLDAGCWINPFLSYPDFLVLFFIQHLHPPPPIIAENQLQSYVPCERRCNKQQLNDYFSCSANCWMARPARIQLELEFFHPAGVGEPPRPRRSPFQAHRS